MNHPTKNHPTMNHPKMNHPKMNQSPDPTQDAAHRPQRRRRIHRPAQGHVADCD
jgi:hypothetical protein